MSFEKFNSSYNLVRTSVFCFLEVFLVTYTVLFKFSCFKNEKRCQCADAGEQLEGGLWRWINLIDSIFLFVQVLGELRKFSTHFSNRKLPKNHCHRKPTSTPIYNSQSNHKPQQDTVTHPTHHSFTDFL